MKYHYKPLGGDIYKFQMTVTDGNRTWELRHRISCLPAKESFRFGQKAVFTPFSPLVYTHNVPDNKDFCWSNYFGAGGLPSQKIELAYGDSADISYQLNTALAHDRAFVTGHNLCDAV